MRIGDLDTTARPIVVAEIGNNHEGRFEVAMRLVQEAARCGADAVKFQTFRTELFVSRVDPDRFARLRSFELTQEQFSRLADEAHRLGLAFVSTPLDLESGRFLVGCADAIKIASGDNDFVPLLELVAASARPLIISTGMSDSATVRRAVHLVKTGWSAAGSAGQLALLHCVSSYPTPSDRAELLAIRRLALDHPDCTIGYSDHTAGGVASVLAVAVGARIIEKHFTLDHHFSSFRDHLMSADPGELARLVEQVREAATMMGSEEKRVLDIETPTAAVARRSICAARDLREGDRVTIDDLVWLRPSGGLPPGSEELVVGKTLLRSIPAGERIRTEDVA